MGCGVVRDEAGEVLPSPRAEPAGAVDLVKPGVDERRRVPDVVQVGRGDQQLGIHPVERRRDPTRLRADRQHVVDPWPQVTEQLVDALLSPLDHTRDSIRIDMFRLYGSRWPGFGRSSPTDHCCEEFLYYIKPPADADGPFTTSAPSASPAGDGSGSGVVLRLSPALVRHARPGHTQRVSSGP